MMAGSRSSRRRRIHTEKKVKSPAPKKRLAEEELFKPGRMPPLEDQEEEEELVVVRSERKAVVYDLISSEVQKKMEADDQELLRLRAELAEVKGINAGLQRALAQSKRARVYALPGTKQLLRWVERCSHFDEFMAMPRHGSEAKPNYATRSHHLRQMMEDSEVRLAQLGGDDQAFKLVLELRTRGRDVTYVLDEDNCDDRFRYGEEVTERLEPFQLRFMAGVGESVSFNMTGVCRGRYAFAEHRENAFNNMLISSAHEEFHVGAPQLLLIIFAHALEFLPLATRRAYLVALNQLDGRTFMHQCLDACGCFEPDGKLKPKAQRQSK
jgi:hypothetical protein